MSARLRQAPTPAKRAKGSARRPKCPICGKPQAQDYRPFCSKHCADVDLGRWLGGRYAVPGEPLAKNDSDSEADGDP